MLIFNSLYFYLTPDLKKNNNNNLDILNLLGFTFENMHSFVFVK